MKPKSLLVSGYIVLMGVTLLSLASLYVSELSEPNDTCPALHEPELWPVPPICTAREWWRAYAAFCLLGGISYLFFLLTRHLNCTWTDSLSTRVDLNRMNFAYLRLTVYCMSCEAIYKNCGYYCAGSITFVLILTTVLISIAFIPLTLNWEGVRVIGEGEDEGGKVSTVGILLFILSPIHFIQLMGLLGKCCCAKPKGNSSTANGNAEELRMATNEDTTA